MRFLSEKMWSPSIDGTGRLTVGSFAFDRTLTGNLQQPHWVLIGELSARYGQQRKRGD